MSSALRVSQTLFQDLQTPSIPPPIGASQPRVALMAEPGIDYVAGTLGTWLARGITVPLCLSHPDKELSYVLRDSGAAAVLASPLHVDRMRRLAAPLGTRVFPLDTHSTQQQHHMSRHETEIKQRVTSAVGRLHSHDGALIVYTSGTTGPPKGVLHTHHSLTTQIHSLCAAWEWQKDDRILHTLPLHHIHGIVNALYCPLAVGATVEMMPSFSPTEVWSRLQREHNNNNNNDAITVFMGVPTMFAFLLNTTTNALIVKDRDAGPHLVLQEDSEYYNHGTGDGNHLKSNNTSNMYKNAAQRLRLTVSGSAACPLPIMNAWRNLSGSFLLERYGMSETGMLLGNPLHGTRVAGTVGQPFPGVQVRINGETGELCVKSDQLFAGYWGRPEATAEAYDADGYFKTGDTAEMVVVGPSEQSVPYYKILGRTSVDIIKHGGYKISALAIESELLEHPALTECAVVGLPDAEYGEVIGVVAALKKKELSISRGVTPLLSISIEELREWAKERLPGYQLPSVLRVLPQLPRNAMGKVNKKALRADVFPEWFSSSLNLEKTAPSSAPAA